MRMNYYLFVSLSQLLIVVFSGLCPEPEEIAPCLCNFNDQLIYCGGPNVLNLKNIFHRLSLTMSNKRRDYKTFRLSSPFITSLDEHTFYDITFENIEIINATNLSSIHVLAFEGTNLFIKKFVADSTQLIVDYRKSNDIFSAVMTMNILESFTLTNSKITEIPNNAFKPANGKQLKLNTIRMNSNNLIKLGDLAFYYLPNLTNLNLSHNKIDFISELALKMEDPFQTQLILDLSFNNLDETAVKDEPFHNLNKPAIIDLTENKGLTKLESKVFQAFLNFNVKNNRIRIDNLNCTDCASSWLVETPKYEKALEFIKCSDRHPIKDSIHFPKCLDLIVF